LLYLPLFSGATGSRWTFSAASCDQIPKNLACSEMFGGDYIIPVPDVDRSDFLLVLGANPAVSNGSLLTAPNLRARLAAIRQRGGKVVVIDPRRSETAALGDEHHFIRPGADAALLLAMIRTLFDEGRVNLGRCGDFANGLDRVRERVAPYTPERVTTRCGIDAETIRRLARELAEADSAVAYGRMGTCCQPFGTLACWAIDLLNLLTGNLDRPGGAMFARAAAPIDFAFAQGEDGIRFGRHRSRVSGYDEIFGELPVAALAEEIETEGDGRVRALITYSGNPVLSAPDSDRLDAALGSLDFMVSLDFYLNETTRHAKVILPPAGPLENNTYDLSLYNLAVRNVVKWSPAAFEVEPGGRRAWEIVLELARRIMGVGDLDTGQFDDLVLRQVATMALAGSPLADRLDSVVEALGPRRGPARLLDLLIRIGPYGEGFGRAPDGLTLSRVIEHEHGLDLGPLEPALPGKLATASGRIELAPPRILDDLPRLDDWLEEETGAVLTLIGRRDPRSMNSWLHNSERLLRGRERCTLQVHPDDARRLGLRDGDAARLSTEAGELVAPVELSDRLMPGVVSLPHGWGHDLPGVGLGVASRRPGVNANRLLAARDVDAPSGASVLNGVPVTVESASTTP
jgi:anaerobic selenocysteine-containing dehydrogenase